MTAKRTVLWALILLIAPPALAHGPVARCQAQGERIACTGAFADGESAKGLAVDVIGYDEQLLVSGKFDKESRFSFARPVGEFYVLVDAGPGETFEIDYKDIAGP